ncbi:MAG: TVP38/TMEM64 family protein [Acaryochloridaceae cyanobacterium CSU_3_4]|nr:TVP38/TMEM64 family protein [Acaryochloridaceae cyanobacterium CSU_3_4]
MTVRNGQRLKFVLIAVVTFWVMTAAPAWAADGDGFNPQQLLREVLEAIKGLGPGGAIAFIGIYILATVAFFPGSILTLGAGFVFGVVQGSILVFIGATIGATLAFLLGRDVARDWVAEKIAGNPKFTALDRAIGRAGLKIVLLTRLSPVFPLNSKYE